MYVEEATQIVIAQQCIDIDVNCWCIHWTWYYYYLLVFLLLSFSSRRERENLNNGKTRGLSEWIEKDEYHTYVRTTYVNTRSSTIYNNREANCHFPHINAIYTLNVGFMRNSHFIATSSFHLILFIASQSHRILWTISYT